MNIKNPFRNAKLVSVNTNPDVYHRTVGGLRGTQDFIMSRGALADFVSCPSKWRSGYTSKETNATKWGSLIDALALSPDQFDDRFAVYPDTYTNEKKEVRPWNNNATVCKDWKRKHPGKSFIYRERVDDDGNPDEETKIATLGNAQRAIDRLKKDNRIHLMLSCADTQVMVMAEYRDRATGIIVPFKVLLDIVPDVNSADWGKCLADFKTARDAEEREFTQAVHSGFYDWQAAIYRDAYVAATDEDRTDFLFVVQENTPPYEPAVWAIGESWMNEARAEVISALEFYCGCLASDTWPSYRISEPICSWGALSREAWMLRNIPRPPQSTSARTQPEPKPVYDTP